MLKTESTKLELLITLVKDDEMSLGLPEKHTVYSSNTEIFVRYIKHLREISLMKGKSVYNSNQTRVSVGYGSWVKGKIGQFSFST